MKKISLSASALAFAAVLAAAPAAHAETTPGWYAAAGIGADFSVDPTLRSAAGAHDATDETANLDVMGGAGYAFENGLRLEAEYFHNQNNTTGVSGFSGAGGHLINNALFANALYDFDIGERFTPYVGAGVGPDFINVTNVGANGVGFLEGSTVALAYQGIVGVSSQLDKNWAVTADYRYVASMDPKVDHAGAGAGRGRMDNASNNILVGLRYSFDEPEAVKETPYAAQAPVVQKHKAAMPVIAPTAQDFVVFFDFNKSTLTPEARHILKAAAKNYKNGKFTKIAVTGHTDTVGTVAYNDKLSMRRAKAVETYLTKLGVDTKEIHETGVGEKNPLVPTAPDVREARNRRAEIVLGK